MKKVANTGREEVVNLSNVKPGSITDRGIYAGLTASSVWTIKGLYFLGTVTELSSACQRQSTRTLKQIILM
jgi:hypothetical protein